VRPGHIADFEALLKESKEAGEKAANTQPLFVSRRLREAKARHFTLPPCAVLSEARQEPTIRDILGEEGYKKFLQVNAESVEQTESTLFRFSPELSNPPEEVATVAADFWHPKAMMAAAPSKPKATAGKDAELKPASAKPKE